MENIKKENREMHTVVYFILCVWILSMVLSAMKVTISRFAEYGYSVMLVIELFLFAVAIHSLSKVFVCQRIGAFLYFASTLAIGVLERDFVMAVAPSVLLLLVLQIKKNGVSAWELIMRGDIDGEDVHQ